MFSWKESAVISEEILFLLRLLEQIIFKMDELRTYGY